MARPVHFEIHALDPEAARVFYKTVFGWRFQQWGDKPYWLVITGDGDPMAGLPHSQPGIDGGLVPRQDEEQPVEGQPVNAFVVTVDVPDCQEYVDRVVAAGGSVVVARAPTPGVGWLAYVTDLDGNILGLMQTDPTAQ